MKQTRFLGFIVVIVVLCHTARAASPFQVYDAAEFAKIIDVNTAVLTTNANTNVWLEGPVWIPSGGYLLFCDQDRNRLRRIDLPNTVSDFLLPPTGTLYNGTMLDAQERLLGAQAGTNGLRIVMITNSLTATNVVTVLNSTCHGWKFYSPNDLIVKSDGTIWFTDPGYNGVTKPPPQPNFAPGYYVYHFDPTNGDATCTPIITNGIIRPNGLCFSPDESKLYVADSDTGRHRILIYNVQPDNTVTGGTVFAVVTNGIPDGIRCDADGRIWSSGGDGAYIFSPTNGHLIGKIKFGRIANLCWGGPDYKTVFMTGQPVVTSVHTLVTGQPSAKKLQTQVDGSQVNLTWPAPSTGFVLQETGALDGSGSWTTSDATMMTNNGLNTVTLDATNDGKFFRLKHP